jgi:translation initiation factor 2 subunit 2
MEYEQALQRALAELPERAAADDRLSVPTPAAEADGAFTRLTNITEIADALSRDPNHLHRVVQREFGTNGQFEGGQARYNGSFSTADFEAAIDGYVAEFVTCSECGLPDTKLVTENGIDMLRCQACGAFRPVEKQRVKSTTSSPTLQEGGTYEVKIVGTGRKGDGVAEKGKYTIFVPGASEGDVVTVRIENIDGNLAFSRLVN